MGKVKKLDGMKFGKYSVFVKENDDGLVIDIWKDAGKEKEKLLETYTVWYGDYE